MFYSTVHQKKLEGAISVPTIERGARKTGHVVYVQPLKKKPCIPTTCSFNKQDYYTPPLKKVQEPKNFI